jgi:hypothetical protein
LFFYSLRLKLKHFEKFKDTTEALAAATAAVEGKVSKTLKKTLKKLVDEDVQNQLLGKYIFFFLISQSMLC